MQACSALLSDKGKRSVGSLWTPQFNFQDPSVPASHLESAPGEMVGGADGTVRNTPLMGCFYFHKIRTEDRRGMWDFYCLFPNLDRGQFG